jgi:hypothetical protein
MKYFAKLPKGEIGPELYKKIEDYYEYLRTSGREALLRHSWETYYKPGIEGGKLYHVGEQNEYVKVHVNHFRNIVQHMLSLTVSQRPAFEPRAANTDYKSQCQTILAGGLLDYYMREKDLEQYIKDASEKGILLGEGWVYSGWNATSGEIYNVNPDTQAPIYEGDIEFETFGPFDIIRDFTKSDHSKHLWFIVRRYANRYNLEEKYPEHKEALARIADDYQSWRDTRLWDAPLKESEDIPLFTLYHKPCEALPTGRIVEFVDSDTILLDGPLPYRGLPLHRIVPSVQFSTCFGYSNIWDLLPLQTIIDNLHSTISTNQEAFGVQNIMCPKGNNINVTQLAGGLNLIEFDPKAGGPEPLNLLQTSPETYQYLAQLVQEMETLSGVNSVTRGNPESSLKSGAALALVQSLAIQFSQPLQQSYARLLENVGTAVINVLRDFAEVPRVAMIVGKSQRGYMREFTGDDLKQINRVLVDMGNPLTRTTAGRVNMAEMLLQGGLIENPDQFLQVITTGKLEPMIQGKQKELLCMADENERLGEGRPVQAILTDNHAMHIQEHKSVLASPDARENPQVVQSTLGHIQEHIELLQSADPITLQMLGQQPLQPVLPPGQQGAPNQALPAEVAGQAADMMNATNPLSKAAQGVKLPKMPKNPLEQ